MKSIIAAVLALALVAADWPQWRGPNRDGHSADTGLAKTWPTGGPKLLWTFKDAGIGYGTPIVVGSVVYVLGAKEDSAKEFAVAIDATTGKEKWRTDLEVVESGMKLNSNWGGGPRSAPTFNDGKLYALGVLGDLTCLDASSGKVIWHKSLTKDLGGQVMKIWGYSESPLVDGDLVVCTPGYGKKGVGTVAALDKRTGEVRWQSKNLNEEATYASLVVSTVGGIKAYVGMTPKGAFGVSATDGTLLWSVDKVAANDISVIPTPIVSGDSVYVTSNYPAGTCALLNLKAAGSQVSATTAYNNKNLKNHHGGVVLVDGHVFGSNGNASQKDHIPFVCQELKSGSVAWSEESLEPSSVSVADGRLFVFGQNTGKLVWVEPSSKGFKEVGHFTVPESTKIRKGQGGIWTHPVIANGRLYLRDQDLLFCYDLK